MEFRNLFAGFACRGIRTRTHSRKYSQLPVIAFLILLASVSRANDFASLQSNLQQQQANLELLETMHGRHSYQLVESLHGLARTQLTANRFDDAAASIDRAIQVTRLNHGLYAPEQYDLLITDIEVDMSRRDWKEALTKLQHFSWLIGSRYQGSALQRLDLLEWMAATHLRGALNDTKEQRPGHLIAATEFNELAVQYAQATEQADSLRYAELLYSLTRKYHIESRGILGGGRTSYFLRLVNPQARQVDTRSGAVDKRYRAGLDKLHMIRDMLLASDQFDLEAVAMVELYIADWHALFNEAGNLETHYSASINRLLEAGVEPDLVDHLLAAPAVLPRPTLHLSVADALTETDGGRRSIGSGETSDSFALPEYRLTVLEPHPELIGYGLDGESAATIASTAGNWPALQVNMLLDPSRQVTVRTSGYFSKSYVTGTDVSAIDPPPMRHSAMRAVLSRIKNLAFRPAFSGGKAVSATISLDFLFQDESAVVGFPSVVLR